MAVDPSLLFSILSNSWALPKGHPGMFGDESPGAERSTSWIQAGVRDQSTVLQSGSTSEDGHRVRAN